MRSRNSRQRKTCIRRTRVFAVREPSHRSAYRCCLLRSRPPPNGVTAISAVLSVLGVLVLAFAPIAVYTGVIAAFLFALAYAFDSADGQLARLTRTGGPAGEWLDHTVDMGKTVLFHGAILFSLILHTSNVNAGLAALVIGFTTVSVVAFFAWLLVDLLRRANPEPLATERNTQTHAPLLRSPYVYPATTALFAGC